MVEPAPVDDIIPPPEHGEKAERDDVGVNIISHGFDKPSRKIHCSGFILSYYRR